MEIHRKRYYQLEDGQHGPQKNDVTESTELTGPTDSGSDSGSKELAPGIPVVRSNTPRPLSFIPTLSNSGLVSGGAQGDSPSLPTFPAKAPSAPPLPEELGEQEDDATTISLSQKTKPPTENAQEFIWLFEYGLEMDSALLNSPERLDSLALFYGPAVLKGYNLMFARVATSSGYSGGQAIVTIVPSMDPTARVWGVLYRIPHRTAERTGEAPSLLDTVHAASAPRNLFKALQVVVHETYRQREIPCITYIATTGAQQQLHSVTQLRDGTEMQLLQRLIAIARKQKLPDSYLNANAVHAFTHLPMPEQTVQETPVVLDAGDSNRASIMRLEQNTDPLPIVHDPRETSAETVPDTPAISPSTNHWLIAFALYLAMLLLLVLTLAVLQGLGLGSDVLTSSFMPLGVPWLVLVYGLLGGCVSSIVTLGKSPSLNPPVFVIITWFTRPYIGIVLATLTYLFFTSGFFILGENVARHSTFFLLTGALAGLCEGFIFVKRR